MDHGMKTSTIKRILNKKLDEWVDSIKDQTLANDVKVNTIVTGGSIASMLMGDPVNDFDVYFTNKETAFAVADYYCKEFVKNNPIKTAEGVHPVEPFAQYATITNCKKQIEDRVVIFIKSAGVVTETMSETGEEYAYFEGKPEEDLFKFVETITKESTDKAKPKYRPVFLSQNAITLSDKMQIVIRFFGTPEEIHDNYDFVHATCYYDWGNRNLVLKPEALTAMMSKTLIYHGSLYPMASIFRTRKFIERGWRISAGQLLKIMWQINELNLKDMGQLREQLTGVDMAYMYQLLGELKDKDISQIDSTYIANIIDKIFD